MSVPRPVSPLSNRTSAELRSVLWPVLSGNLLFVLAQSISFVTSFAGARYLVADGTSPLVLGAVVLIVQLVYGAAVLVIARRMQWSMAVAAVICAVASMTLGVVTTVSKIAPAAMQDEAQAHDRSAATRRLAEIEATAATLDGIEADIRSLAGAALRSELVAARASAGYAERRMQDELAGRATNYAGDGPRYRAAQQTFEEQRARTTALEDLERDFNQRLERLDAFERPPATAPHAEQLTALRAHLGAVRELTSLLPPSVRADLAPTLTELSLLRLPAPPEAAQAELTSAAPVSIAETLVWAYDHRTDHSVIQAIAAAVLLDVLVVLLALYLRVLIQNVDEGFSSWLRRSACEPSMLWLWFAGRINRNQRRYYERLGQNRCVPSPHRDRIGWELRNRGAAVAASLLRFETDETGRIVLWPQSPEAIAISNLLVQAGVAERGDAGEIAVDAMYATDVLALADASLHVPTRAEAGTGDLIGAYRAARIAETSR